VAVLLGLLEAFPMRSRSQEWYYLTLRSQTMNRQVSQNRHGQPSGAEAWIKSLNRNTLRQIGGAGKGEIVVVAPASATG
jgi:hypothetical protein